MPIEKAIRESRITPPLELEGESLLELEDEGLVPEDDSVVLNENEDGSVDVDFNPEQLSPAGDPNKFDANLAEFVKEPDLEKLGSDLLALIDADDASRKEWEEIVEQGTRYLGFKIEEVSEPFPNACSATHPLLAESIVKYQAKARSQLLPPKGPVHTVILGKRSDEKEAKAKRVRDYLNHQVQNQMPEYAPEHDRMLFHQGLMGSAFTKMYFDAVLKRPVSRFIKAQNFLINYEATDLESAERYTETLELSANDLKRYQNVGFYLDVDLNATVEGDTSPIKEGEERISGIVKSSYSSEDESYRLYESHTYWDVPGFEDENGLKLPYIITLDSESGKVVSIYRNWKEADPARKKRVWYVHWPFIPGLGFYAYGYIHLVGGLSRCATSALRQLIDAGSFANLPAGFKAHGLRVVGDDEPISPGEWRDVNAPGMDISKSLIPLPYKEPSQTLFHLLGFVVEAGQRFADSAEQVVADSTNYGPVGTTMALLEAGNQLFNAIHERLFEAQKREFRILMEINAESMGKGLSYDVAGATNEINPQDFEGGVIDVIPVSDPRTPSEAHRIARVQAQLHIASQFPQEHNVRSLLARMHAALGDDDPQSVLKPLPEQGKPADPVSENLMAMAGMPIAVGEYQHHPSHLKVHLSAIASKLYGSNPQVVAALTAHIQQTIAADHKSRFQREMGAALPQQGQQLPPEQENELARKAAEVADEIVEETQDILEEDQMSPLIEKQLEIEKSKVALDAMKLGIDDKFRREELATETGMDKKELAAKLLIEQAKIAQKDRGDTKKVKAHTQLHH